MTDTITITQPDDWHVHGRDGVLLRRVIGFTAARFGRALMMPNLDPPVTTVAAAIAYRQRILATLPRDTAFNPMMSLYLTDATPPDEVMRAAESPHVLGFKLYPAGATTHSAAGVVRINDLMPVFEAMAKQDVVLQVHGEVTDPQVDVFDREAVFIEQVLAPLHHLLPELRIVLEHVTTREGVDFVAAGGENIAATITAHHLLLNRNAMFRDGLRPYVYCLPPLKREPHRQALCEVVASGDPSFFLGSDSAPHTRRAKLQDCGCAGIFSALGGLEIYAEIFDQLGCLDHLEGFASRHGARFYGLAENPASITLYRRPQIIPPYIGAAPPADDALIPLKAGETVGWSLDNLAAPP